MEMSSRLRIALAAAVVSVALPGCLGSSDSPSEPATSRVDSAERFQGERAVIASVLERWERAVLAGELPFVCDRLLAVRENRGNDNDNGGRRSCERDAANDPHGLVSAAGGEAAFDLIVRDVEIDRHRNGSLSAVARITAGSAREVVSLRKRARLWEIAGRAFLQPTGNPARGGCRLDAIVGVNWSSPRKAKVPRQAVLQGPFAREIRGVVERGGSLVLAGISYAPDYSHLYELRDPKRRLISQFPVTVWGPRSYDASSKYFCHDGKHVAGIIL